MLRSAKLGMGSSDGIRLSLSQAWRGRASGGFEHVIRGAEELQGLAGFGDDTDGLGKGFCAGPHAGDAAVEASKDEDGTARDAFTELIHERDAVAAGHVDVAEDEVGREGGDLRERVLGVVDRVDLEAVAAEDETQSTGYERFIVDD